MAHCHMMSRKRVARVLKLRRTPSRRGGGPLFAACARYAQLDLQLTEKFMCCTVQQLCHANGVFPVKSEYCIHGGYRADGSWGFPSYLLCEKVPYAWLQRHYQTRWHLSSTDPCIISGAHRFCLARFANNSFIPLFCFS
jgi:hypothetical protein